MGTSVLFFAIFLVLKLTHVIDWSWWWVTSPLWIEAIVWLLIVTIGPIAVAMTGRKVRVYGKVRKRR